MVGVHGGSAWAAYEVIEVAGVVRGCRGCPDLLISVKRWVAGKVFRQGGRILLVSPAKWRPDSSKRERERIESEERE